VLKKKFYLMLGSLYNSTLFFQMGQHCTCILFFFALQISYTEAQAPFQRAIGAEGYEKGTVIRLLPDGGYILAGETDKSFGLQESDMLMLRTDGSGNVLWSQTYGGPEREVINDVVPTPDSGLLAVGEKYQPNKKEGEFLTMIKTDAMGNLLWKKTFDEGGNETEGFSMAATADGNYVVTGIVKNMSIVSDAFFTMRGEDQSLFLLKVDGNGNKLWSRRLGTSSSNDVSSTGVSVITARDGSYIVTGNITKKGRTDRKLEKPVESVSEDEERNMLLAKVNQDGTLAWAKEYSANRVTAGFSVIEKKEGGFCVAGIAITDAPNNVDIFVMSADADGNMKWAKTYGGPEFESMSDLMQTPDSGFIISGVTESYGSGFEDALLFKIDNNGSLLWAKALGGKGSDYAMRTALAADGIVVAGEVSTPPGESFDVMLVKTDADGNSGCFSKSVPLKAADFKPVSTGIEKAHTAPVERGITPPNFKKADVSNINGQSRQLRTKNICN